MKFTTIQVNMLVLAVLCTATQIFFFVRFHAGIEQAIFTDNPNETAIIFILAPMLGVAYALRQMATYHANGKNGKGRCCPQCHRRRRRRRNVYGE